MIYKLILYFILFFLVACTGREVRMELHGAAYCVSSKVLFHSPMPEMDYVEYIMEDEVLKKRFSPKSLRMAIAYGIADDLKKYIELEEQMKPESPKSLEFLNLESKIYRRIQTMELDIQSTASEMNCYVDRFTEILSMMKDKEDDIVESNTFYAIVTGAVAALADGSTVYNTPTNQAIILAGGLSVAFFGYMAFKPNITVDFKPKSTNLKELWFNAEESVNFSSALWFLMTRKVLKDEPTPREFITNRWIENGYLGQEGEDRKEHVELFFGGGGVSTLVHLTNRKEMNTELRTMIQLFEQDVRALELELSGNIKK